MYSLLYLLHCLNQTHIYVGGLEKYLPLLSQLKTHPVAAAGLCHTSPYTSLPASTGQLHRVRRRRTGSEARAYVPSPFASYEGSESQDPAEGEADSLQSASSSPGSSSRASSATSSMEEDQSKPYNMLLELPLLAASKLSHVNRQYIRMRRRQKWWNKLGGYPKVCSALLESKNTQVHVSAVNACTVTAGCHVCRSLLFTFNAKPWSLVGLQ